MNNVSAVKRTQASTPCYATGKKPATHNLGDRFSAESLQTISIADSFHQPGVVKPSTSERNAQIAKVAVAVTGVAVMIFAAYRYLSEPLYCTDFVGTFSGVGKECMFENGSKYQGEWENGAISGQGSYTRPSGHVFSGRFEQYAFVHEGRKISLRELNNCLPENLTDCVVALRNKDCFTIDPLYSGTVDCTYPSGARYQGNVQRPKWFSGQGSYTNPSGDTFSGLFQKRRLQHEGGAILLEELNRCKPEGLFDCVLRYRQLQARETQSYLDGDQEVWG